MLDRRLFANQRQEFPDIIQTVGKFKPAGEKRKLHYHNLF